MKNLFLSVLFLSQAVFAQKTLEFNDASRYFNVRVDIANCTWVHQCRGPATFSLFRKGAAKPYQRINLERTVLWDWQPSVNGTMLYDQQSLFNIDDFNFDGMEDIAICDGPNGSYWMPSYRIYLSSRKKHKFVYDRRFSDLGHHLGMFSIDKERKVLETFDKSGCCYHILERYKVVKNRPLKVYRMEQDATGDHPPDDWRMRITTKRRVRGKWKTTIRYEKV